MKRFLRALVALGLLVGGAGVAKAQPSYVYTTLRPAAPVDPAIPVGAGSDVSAGEGGEAERRLPFHLHWQGRKAGDRHDS
jgi:hypothetical protein